MNYKFDQVTFSKWLAKSDQIIKAAGEQNTARLPNSNPSKLGYPEMERLLLTAFKERRNEGRAVSALWLKMKGREIVQQVYGETDFKASRGWMFNFIKRNNLSFRRKTNNKKESVETKLGAFARFHDLFETFIVDSRNEQFHLSKMGKVSPSLPIQLGSSAHREN